MAKIQRILGTPEVCFTLKGARQYIIIHEMIDAYSRILKKNFREPNPDMKYDSLAITIMYQATYCFGLDNMQ